MNILITGNQGYVGPVVVRHLRRALPDARIVGFDTAYFAHCLTGSPVLPEHLLDAQHFGDIRRVPQALLEEADAVVHLAAVSNDPIGTRFEQATDDVNHRASVELAARARDAGVTRFVFASSCSVYGFAPGGARSERDTPDPQTAYARSKVATERALGDMDLGAMTTTALRFATACGWSDRLRLDLVLNDFVAAALTTGVITVLSDGTPWRPLIDVRDMALAIEWALTRDRSAGGPMLAVNAGADDANYQVKGLAHAVAEAIPGTSVRINTAAQPDTRSYRVDFSLYAGLAPGHMPRVGLKESIEGLRDGLTSMGFNDPEFRESQLVRLHVLDGHIAAGRLGADLTWIRRFAAGSQP